MTAPGSADRPNLQGDVTRAITTAFFEELADVGYGRLSVDAVARRAGTGKAAIYRRWATREEMAVSLLSSVAVDAVPLPDTGSLHGDVHAFLGATATALAHPLARRIVPDVLAECARNPVLRDALRRTVQEPRRENGARLLARAVERRELPRDHDADYALDVMMGALYWRLLVTDGGVAPADVGPLTDATVAAVRALGPARG